MEKIVASLDKPIDFSIIIAQHMHALALGSFAKRLDRLSAHEVVFVKDRCLVEPAKIYLLEDSSYLEQEDAIYIKKYQEPKGFYHPDIDTFFLSAQSIKHIEFVVYLLSGMGRDGAKGMLELKKLEHKTVAQDEQSSIIYGMPKSALEMGASCAVMSIDEIIEDIKRA